jgi:general secretion pathway protein K
MFSIYAVGVKKGYKRETRVKLHAVVDFRTAPPLGTPGAPGTPQAGTPTTTTGTTTTTTTGPASADAIAAALKPSSGGQVVYFRAE